MKDGFEEMEHEFLFGIFRPEKQDYLFRCSVAPGNFPPERPKKVMFHSLSNLIFRNLFINGKQPGFLCALTNLNFKEYIYCNDVIFKYPYSTWSTEIVFVM